MEKEKLIRSLQSHPEIEAAILFGSEASQSADRESDIDIALLYDFGKEPKGLDLLQFKEDLSVLMERKVDIVILNTASPIIAMQAVKNGIPLYIHDARAYSDFEIRLITDYADLKRLREPFEKNILKRKLHD